MLEVDEDTMEMKTLVAMLREVSKVFGTRDIIEEYLVCKCFPVCEAWSISLWTGKERRRGGPPMPDFSASFGVTKHG